MGIAAAALVPTRGRAVLLLRRGVIAVALALALIVAVVPPVGADTGVLPSVDGQAVDRFVAAQMAKHRIPGVALVLVEDGRVTEATGYGTAGSDRPMTADTPMSIGSVTKSFTAVAVLQLVEVGRIDLDAPVQAYLPWFRVADDAASRDITVRHLLQHTSGLSEFGYNRVHPPDTTLEEGVRDLRDARPTAPVGTAYQYFSPNYQTLALIIETVSGRSYGDYVTERIFAPLQMTRSYASQQVAQAAGMAQGHSKLFGFPVTRDHPFRRYMLGAGYLISTARDLSHFLIAMGNEGVYEGVSILSPASVALMRPPTDEQGGAPRGMAWGASRYHGETWEGAAGADETFMSQLLLSPDRGRGYVSLLNQQHLLDPAYSQLPEGLTALLLGQQPEEGGLSMRFLGLMILGGVLITLVLTVRSTLRLRGWTERSRALSAAALARTIVPRFLVPVVVLVAVYRVLGPLLFGTAWAFNVGYVGRYMIPDIALLIFLNTVPDLAQGLYMAAAVVLDRIRRHQRRDGAVEDHVHHSASPQAAPRRARP